MSYNNIPIVPVTDEEEDDKFFRIEEPVVKTEDKTEKQIRLENWVEKNRDSMSSKEVANLFRDQKEEYLNPEYSDKDIIRDEMKDNPWVLDVLAERPGFEDQVYYSGNQIWNSMSYGMPEVVASFIPEKFEDFHASANEYAADTYRDYKEHLKQKREEDPKFAAWEAWNRDDGSHGIESLGDVLDLDLFGKAVGNMMSTGITMTAGVAGGFVGALGGPGGAAAGFTGASAAAGYLLEGSDEAISSLDYLTEDRPVSKKLIDSKIEDYRNILSKQPLSPKALDAEIDRFTEQNFGEDEKGGYFVKGMSIEEAQSVNDAAVVMYSLTAGTLELIPLGRYMDRIGVSVPLKKYIKGASSYKLVDKFRQLPKTNLNRLLPGAQATKDFFGDVATEALTESAQYTSQILAETAPGIGYRDESFGELYSLPMMLESGVMGAMTGGTMSIGMQLSRNTISPHIENYKNRTHKTGVGAFARAVEVDGVTKYEFALNDNGIIQGPEEGGTITQDMLDGDNIDRYYDSKKEAMQAAMDWNQSLQEEQDLEHLSKLGFLVSNKAKTKLVKSPDGKTFSVEIRSKDGTVLHSTEAFGTRAEAKREKRFISANIKKTTTIYNRSTKKRAEDTKKVMDDNKENVGGAPTADGVDSDLLSIITFSGSTDKLNPTEQEESENLGQQGKYTVRNPQFMLDAVKKKIEQKGVDGLMEELQQRGSYEDTEVGTGKEQLLEELTDINEYEGEINQEEFGSIVQEYTTLFSQDSIKDSIAQEETSSIVDEIIEEPTTKSEQQTLFEDTPDIVQEELTDSLKEETLPDESQKVDLFSNKELTDKELSKKVSDLESKEKLSAREKMELLSTKREQDKRAIGPIETEEEVKEIFLSDLLDNDVVTANEIGISKLPKESSAYGTVTRVKDDVAGPIETEEEAEARDRETIEFKKIPSLEEKKDIVSKKKYQKSAPSKPVYKTNEQLKEDRDDATKDLLVAEGKGLDSNEANARIKLAETELELNELREEQNRVDRTYMIAEGQDASMSDLNEIISELESVTKKIGELELKIDEDELSYNIVFGGRYDGPRFGNESIFEGDTKLQKKTSEQTIKKRKLRKVIKHITKKVIFADGSKITVKFDSKQEAVGMYDPKTKTITINPDKAGMDTPFHEIAHPIIDDLYASNPVLFESLYNEVINSTYGKSIIKDVLGMGYEKDSDIFKIEVIAEALGRVAAGKYKSPKNPIVKAIANLMNWIRGKFFGPLYNTRMISGKFEAGTSIQELAEILASDEYVVKVGDIPKNMLEAKEMIINMVKYQHSNIVTNKNAQKKLFRTIEMTIKVMKQQKLIAEGMPKYKTKSVSVEPYEFHSIVTRILEDEGLVDVSEEFNDWFFNRFEGTQTLKDRYDKTLTYRDDKRIWIEGDELNALAQKVFNNDGGKIREGLAGLSESNTDISQERISQNEAIFMQVFDTILTPEEYALLARMATGLPTIEEFGQQAVKKFNLGNVTDYHMLNETQSNLITQLYNNFNSSINTNSNKEDKTVNDIDNYILRMSFENRKLKIDKLELKRGQDPEPYSKSNAQKVKTNLLNVVMQNRIIALLSDADFKTLRKTDKVDSNGQPISEYDTRMNFLNTSELITVNEELLKMGLVIVGSRGDSNILFIAPIKQEHYMHAKNPISFWKTQTHVDAGVRNKIIESYKKLSDLQISGELAVHEAMSHIFPRYLDHSLSKVIKRLKIMTGGITYSKHLDNFKIGKFNPKDGRYSWVYENEDGVEPGVTDLTQSLSKNTKNNVGDGATIMSQKFVSKLRQAFGLKQFSKLKTVLYNRVGLDTIAMKHEQFVADKGLKIYKSYKAKNQKLIAEIDQDGNIMFYGNNGTSEGQYVDLLATPDEVKLFDGQFDQDIVDMPGKSLGLVKIDSKSKKHAKHGAQWYNYVYGDTKESQDVIDAYKNPNNPNSIISKVKRNLKKMFFVSNDNDGTTNTEISNSKLLEFLNYRKKNEADGFMPDLIGQVELGAYKHKGVASILSSIVMKRLAMPAFTSSMQEGSRYDMSPNFRGDLKPGEVALGSENSTMIWLQYAAAKGLDSEQWNREKNSGDLTKINEWLSGNIDGYFEQKVLITRFPVPHDGGVILAKVKRLHDKKSVIELHPDDTFNRLEGDYDGDSVQAELLEPGLETAIEEYFKGYKSTSIDLKKYANAIKVKEPKFYNSVDRFRLIHALGQGKTAISQVANAASVYGQMIQIYKSIQISSSFKDAQGKKQTTFVDVVLRKPNEKFRWNVSWVNNSKKTHAYIDITVAEYIRTMVQASVDNAEFMLLDKWIPSSSGTVQMHMFQNLFKTANGKSITAEDAKSLKPIFDMHKIPNNARNGIGEDINFIRKELNLEEFINVSAFYNHFINNRVEILTNLASDSGLPTIMKLDINEGVVAPIEELMRQPSDVYEDGRIFREGKKYNYIEVGSPFDILGVVHANSHKAALDILILEESKILKALAKKALPNASVTELKQYIIEQRNKGRLYGVQMTNAFFAQINKIKEITVATTDRNAGFLEFKEKYDSEYKELDKIAQVVGTYVFLEQYSEQIYAGKAGLPPVNSNKNEYQTLDERVMKAYFKAYNKELVSNKDSLYTERFKYGPDETINEVVEGMCRL